jgi:hypothetical protein
VQYRPFESGIDVLGQAVYVLVDGLSASRKVPSKILVEEGIGQLDADGLVVLEPGGWYSMDAYLRAFERLSSTVGEGGLFAIGARVPENAVFPGWVSDIESAIRSVDIAFHMNHRKSGVVMFDANTGHMTEGIGHYGYRRLRGERAIVSECNNPYPCAFDKGILASMARKFAGSSVVRHDDSKPCRTKGEDSCTYIVTW